MIQKIKMPALLLLAALIFANCKKYAGPGGTSVIQGKVTFSEENLGEGELTQITVSSGVQLEHGDYWLYNGANGNLYYIWYNNPTWISNGDPQLTGRMGIKVDFQYSDSNIDIAMATKLALEGEMSSAYSISLNGDIISIHCSIHTDLPDSDNGSTGFGVDVATQGNPDGETMSGDLLNERVYLVYGNGEGHNETTRTGEKGIFRFEGLQIGEYRVYVVGVNPATGAEITVEKSISIMEKKSINDVGTISVTK